jgi:transcriptional regulator with GAF, ATPase, and Fis domain
MTGAREHAVTQAFMSIANSLVDGFDVVELLSGLTADCARLLDVASAGLLLADARGSLHVVAASSERTRNLELFQLQRDEGPCLDCYRLAEPVTAADLRAEARRWPQFVSAATELGFVSVHALPMRLRDSVLGTLGLFGTSTGQLGDDDLDLAQALAHVASVALIADKVAADQAAVNEQLQTALRSRIVIEQAKGLLAQLGNLEMEQAYAVLRRYARDHNERLSDLARKLIGREIAGRTLLEHTESKAAAPPSAPD